MRAAAAAALWTLAEVEGCSAIPSPTLTLTLSLTLTLTLTLQRGVALGALLERLEVRGAGAEGAREELRRHHGAAEGLARAAVVEVEGGDCLV